MNLIVLTGARKGAVVSIDRQVVIGRAAAAELQLPDFLVSQEHAQILRLADRYVLSDLSSTNGTFLNGARVHEAVELRPGDVLQVGTTDVVLTDEARLEGELAALSRERSAVDEEPTVGVAQPAAAHTIALSTMHATERAFSAAPDLAALLDRIARHFVHVAGGREVFVALQREGRAQVVKGLSLSEGGLVAAEEPLHDPERLGEALGQSSVSLSEGPGGTTSLYVPLRASQSPVGVVVVQGVVEPPDDEGLNLLMVGGALAAVHARNHLLVDELRARNVELEHTRRELASLNASLEQAVSARTTELRRSEQRYRGLFSSIPEAVVTLSLEGEVTSWNPGAEELYGYASAEVLGELTPVIPDERVEELSRLLRAVGEGQTLELRSERVSASDEVIPVQLTLAPLPGAAGAIEGVVEIARDIRSELEREELARWRERMSSFADLAAGLGHELGNPLTNLLSGVDLLLATQPDPEALPVLEVLQGEIQRLRRLISETLGLALWSPPEPRPLEVGELLSYVEATIAPRAAEQGVRVELEPGPPLRCAGDQDQLTQALLNLTSNALGAMPEGGTLTLGWRRHERWAQLFVADSGRGIPAQELARIFQLYYTRSTGGSGIGLAIVKRIVDLHRGRVEVESALGEGTRFELSLPLEEGPL